MGKKTLKYDWFAGLGFDFDEVFPEAGGITDLDRNVTEVGRDRKKQPYVAGTTFREGEVAVLRRLFSLAKDDLEARAELAMLIAYTEGKNRLARLE